MPKPNEIVSQMRATLSVSEPDLDTSIGTPIRKILDVVAEAISEAYIDRYLLNYQYDIDTKSGADLDAFVALFGFTRQTSRRASGTMLLQRDTPAPASFVVPSGAQFSTVGAYPVIVQIVTSTTFPRGATSVSVPAQATVGGASGNVAANTITKFSSTVTGLVSVTNPTAFSGGQDAESDAQLRERFKRTIFRSMAGTEDMYLGIALDNSSTTGAKVIGPSERWTEQIQIVSGTATSTISSNAASLTVTDATNASPSVITTGSVHNLFAGDIIKIASVGGNTAVNGTWRVNTTPSTTTLTIKSLDGTTVVAGSGGYTSGGTITVIDRCKWVYPTGYALGASLTSNEVLTPGVHYSINTATLPPTITSLDSVNCPDDIYELTFNYVPISSRNDPPQGITNRVDVYTNGVKSTAASEVAVFDGRVTISSTPGGTYGYNRFRRLDGSYPTSGNIFVRLSLTPLTDLDDAIALGSQALTYGTHYWMVREVGVDAGSATSFDGIEVSASTVQAGTVAITSSTNASPIVLTLPGTHKFQNGQTVVVSGHGTNTAANGTWVVSARDSTHITLTGSTGNGIGGATGTVALVSPTSVGYSYNAVPRETQSAIEGWRLLTTDVVTHAGVPVPLKVHAAVILNQGVTLASIQSAMQSVVADHLANIDFGGTLQVSDLLNVMGDVLGIDAVRLLNSDDLTSHSISGATNATPIVLTVPSGHGYLANDLVVVSGVTGNTAANGTWVVETVGTTTVTLKNSVGNGAYSSGGTIVKGNFAINRMEEDGTTPRTVYKAASSPYRAADIQIADNEYFTLHSVVLTAKAANSWGVY